MRDYKVTKIEGKQGLNTSHRKENHLNRVFIGINKTGGTIAELRIYWSNQTAYACVWIYPTDNTEFLSGSGQAGGGGYDKVSAAAAAAFKSAGIELNQTLSATGRTFGAFEAICKHLAGKKFLCVKKISD